jgi:AraC-like DNA-binding protein/mannose-6-phosphate isomerase-like protein (cupin superfamily)
MNEKLFTQIRIDSIREILHKSYQPSTSGIRHRSGTEYELIYVDYGRLTLDLDGGTYFLGRGNTVIIHPDSVHCLRNPEKTPMHFFNIMFCGELPPEICSQVLDVEKNAQYLMMDMHEEVRARAPGYEVICRNDLTHFLIRILRSAFRTGPAGKKPEILRTARGRRIYETVCNSYGSIRFEDLATSSGVSRSELYLIFRDEIGYSFRQLVSRCKLEQAQYLLRRGDLSLAEIASDIGCELPSLFRMFKKMTGMTPGEYARSLGIPSRHGPDPDPVPRP